MPSHFFNAHPSSTISPPAALSSWLNVEGSLTAMFEAKSGQPLRVERCFEGYRRLSLAQKKQLGISVKQYNRPLLAWVREVELYGDSDQPWVWAQSIFPLPSLQGSAKRLQQLKGTPIGYVLFKRRQTLPNQRFITHTEHGWQRQTRYNWYGRKLLISEIFLPEFLSGLDEC